MIILRSFDLGPSSITRREAFACTQTNHTLHVCLASTIQPDPPGPSSRASAIQAIQVWYISLVQKTLGSLLNRSFFRLELQARYQAIGVAFRFFVYDWQLDSIKACPPCTLRSSQFCFPSLPPGPHPLRLFCAHAHMSKR